MKMPRQLTVASAITDHFIATGPMTSIMPSAVRMMPPTMSILEASWAPGWLKAICVDGWFPDGKIAGFPAQMVLAVGIGVFHICLAMVVKTIGFTKRFGFRNTISTWGWTLLIVGGIILTALGMMEVMGPVAMKWSVIALATVSCLGIFIFNTP
jgi:V/A-type H+-transporting ATPase subunit I